MSKTVFRSTRFLLKIHADDHNPPHLHVIREGLSVPVDLRTAEVLAGQLTQKQLTEVQQFILEHQDELMAVWNELNP